MTDAHPEKSRLEVLPEAEAIVKELLGSGLCARAEIAGSLRRGKPIVHDAEIVAQPVKAAVRQAHPRMPSMIVDPWTRAMRVTLNRAHVWRAPALRDAAGREKLRPWGPRYYCGIMQGSGVQLDLFLVLPPATWGSTLLVRTGSAEFNVEFMTRLRRIGLAHVDGHLTRMQDGSTIPTETEQDMFTAAGLPYIEPAARTLDNLDTSQMLRRLP